MYWEKLCIYAQGKKTACGTGDDSVFFLWTISSFMPLWSEKDCLNNFYPLSLLRLVLCTNMWSVLENVPYVLENNVHFVWFFDTVSCRCQFLLFNC